MMFRNEGKVAQVEMPSKIDIFEIQFNFQKHILSVILTFLNISNLEQKC